MVVGAMTGRERNKWTVWHCMLKVYNMCYSQLLQHSFHRGHLGIEKSIQIMGLHRRRRCAATVFSALVLQATERASATQGETFDRNALHVFRTILRQMISMRVLAHKLVSNENQSESQKRRRAERLIIVVCRVRPPKRGAFYTIMSQVAGERRRRTCSHGIRGARPASA